jgi:hypothetical protein
MFAVLKVSRQHLVLWHGKTPVGVAEKLAALGMPSQPS